MEYRTDKGVPFNFKVEFIVLLLTKKFYIAGDITFYRKTLFPGKVLTPVL